MTVTLQMQCAVEEAFSIIRYIIDSMDDHVNAAMGDGNSAPQSLVLLLWLVFAGIYALSLYYVAVVFLMAKILMAGIVYGIVLCGTSYMVWWAVGNLSQRHPGISMRRLEFGILGAGAAATVGYLLLAVQNIEFMAGTFLGFCAAVSAVAVYGQVG